MTSVGICDSLVLAESPQASTSAGPALTTSLLPLIFSGIGFTLTPFFAADARSRSASKVSDPVACDTAPKLGWPETPLGKDRGMSTGSPDWAAAVLASLSSCSLG